MSFLDRFELVVRSAHIRTEAPRETDQDLHPFETRNIHPDLPKRVRELYDDGYNAEAAFEAFKFIEKEVKRVAARRKGTGVALMMDLFNEHDPSIKLNDLLSESDTDEQLGYKHIFAGAQAGIRNPRGHGVDLIDSPDLCLDHLAVASLLLRKLDDAGLR